MGELRRASPRDVERLWGREIGNDIFILGTGTSLEGFDYHKLSGRVVIALNDAPVIARAEFTYHLWADSNLSRRYIGLHTTDKTICVCDGNGRSQLETNGKCKFIDRVYQFRKQTQPKNLRDTSELFVVSTVASAAITMAWKLGAARIFMLGVDAYRTKAYYADGTQHRSGMTRKVKKTEEGRIVEDRHDKWIAEQRLLRKYLTEKGMYSGPFPQSGIYNLSPKSEIDAWEKVSAMEVIG